MTFMYLKIFFDVDHFKVFIEFVTILLLFYVLGFWAHGMWDLSSPTRDRTRTPGIGRWSLNYWTAREVPVFSFLMNDTSICWAIKSGTWKVIIDPSYICLNPIVSTSLHISWIYLSLYIVKTVMFLFVFFYELI